MKGWIMVHKIKALYDEGNGCSINQIAKDLSMSRNTVKKYLNMNEDEINEHRNNGSREKQLDKYKDYQVHLLQKYPNLTASKIRRKLEAKGLCVSVCERTFRNYVKDLKKKIQVKQKRYYEPVIDMIPGEQCQVDMGELRGVLINNKPATIYFSVFVLSYSRLMYVSASDKPINTKDFIRMHDEAFRYFDGVVEESVYDQTKLVAIREEFREVWFNEEFYRYACFSKFEIRVCEGYDPESKGKVEAGVKYVKNDFFYGEEFLDFKELQESLSTWQDTVANQRVHGTTGRKPKEVYDLEEYPKMKAYLRPFFVVEEDEKEHRGVDRTSLISYKSNKYSVPCIYQLSEVKVKEEGRKLIIHDGESKEVIAVHELYEGKGKVVKNINHYRDHQKLISDREGEVRKVIGDEVGQKLCKVIKETSPKIYKDQLVGFIKLLVQYSQRENFDKALALLLGRKQLRVSFISDYLSAFYTERESSIIESNTSGDSSINMLSNYNCLFSGKGVE